MTRREAERLNHQETVLLNLGFTRDEANALRRISMTLRRWSEAECNGDIERDDDGNGAPFRSFAATGGRHLAYRIPDRERGALARLKKIIEDRNDREIGAVLMGERDIVTVSYYVQGDPRGCALYILRPGDVPKGERADSYYTRGIAVY